MRTVIRYWGRARVVPLDISENCTIQKNTVMIRRRDLDKAKAAMEAVITCRTVVTAATKKLLKTYRANGTCRPVTKEGSVM